MRANDAVDILYNAPTYGWSLEMKEAFRMARDFLASNAEDLDDELEEDG